MPVYGDTAELYSNYSSNNNTRLVYCSWGTPLPTIESAGGTAPTGYTFKEWNTNTSGTGTSYAPGDTTPSVSFLYAIWEEIPYDVTISYKGSTIATMSSSGTKILNTAGTYCEDDITIDYTRAGITVVETLDPNGGTIVSISGDPVMLQTKTIMPTASTQIVSPDSGYNGFASVIVNGDNNLVSSNIASGVSIFGVTGTFEGGGTGWETAPESWVEAYVNRTISEVSGSMVTKIRNYGFYECTNLIAASFPNCSIIGSYAFNYCTSLTTISFPNCTSIGYYAFSYCRNLSIVSFPKCGYIGSYAFSSCSSLTTVSFPNCTVIGDSAFNSCSKLVTVSFDNCFSIGSAAFGSCYKLTNAYFPKCCNIGSYAFTWCSSLETISFPNCIYIDGAAFRGCTKLTNVYFPKCQVIRSSAFSSCSGLTTASFPRCVYIYSQAFINCSKLESIYFLGNIIPRLSNINAFTGTPILSDSYLGHYGSIYVLSRLLSGFKNAAYWSTLSNRIVGI